MDISMPRMDGIEATRILHGELPGVRVIGLSMFEEAERAAAMCQAGAVKYLAKNGPADALIDAIRACARPAGG
jgi:DNA-binding NarL/FixJ family response regulator